MTPDFTILAAGISITRQIKERLLSLSITDEAGGKADSVEITLDDRANAIELPTPGAPLIVAMGYKETFALPMGIFTSGDIIMRGPPDTLTITGTAANMGGSLKDQKTREWDEKNIGQIVETIAGEHDLDPKVSDAYRDFHYDHLDQTNESDMNFLTRIGRDHDALVSVKGGALLFMGKGEGKTVTGLPILPRFIYKGGKTTWRATLANRGAFKSVEAYWHDHNKGELIKVTAGQGTPIKRLRHPFPNEKEAERAAKAKLDETKRGNSTFTVTLPGDPFISAEGQIVAIGFRAGVDGLWSVTSVKHTITNSGYKTTIQAEKPKEKGAE